MRYFVHLLCFATFALTTTHVAAVERKFSFRTCSKDLMSFHWDFDLRSPMTGALPPVGGPSIRFVSEMNEQAGVVLVFSGATQVPKVVDVLNGINADLLTVLVPGTGSSAIINKLTAPNKNVRVEVQYDHPYTQGVMPTLKKLTVETEDGSSC